MQFDLRQPEPTEDCDCAGCKSMALVLATTLALCRIYIGYTTTPEPITGVDMFKDIAHLFVGGLFMSWWHTRCNWKLWVFIGLTVLEVVVAVSSRIL